MVSKGITKILLNGVYWGYNPLTNFLLTSWDIQVQVIAQDQTTDNLEMGMLQWGMT